MKTRYYQTFACSSPEYIHLVQTPQKGQVKLDKREYFIRNQEPERLLGHVNHIDMSTQNQKHFLYLNVRWPWTKMCWIEPPSPPFSLCGGLSPGPDTRFSLCSLYFPFPSDTAALLVLFSKRFAWYYFYLSHLPNLTGKRWLSKLFDLYTACKDGELE
jgi:hypothetical protein